MNITLAAFGMGGGEIVVVMVVALVLFGAKRIPEFAKGIGQGIKEFKKASSDVTSEFHNAMNETTPPPAPAPSRSLPPVELASANPPSTVPRP
jgi:sec-independent protein translocase protein TatA